MRKENNKTSRDP